MPDVQLVANAARVLNVVERTACARAVVNACAIVVKQPQRRAADIKTLLLKKRRRHRAINAAAHGDHDFFDFVIHDKRHALGRANRP